MRFAQFYKLSTGYIAGSIPPRFSPDNVKPIEALGSDGVLIIDGRLTLDNARAVAAERCKARGFIGYSIHHGETFSRSRQVAPFRSVSN